MRPAVAAMPEAPVRITDPADPRLADYASLTDATLRKRYEHRQGVLIAEGPNPVRRLLSSPYPVRSLLLAEERVAEQADLIAELARRADPPPVYVVTRELLVQLVRYRLHQGVIACGARRPPLAPEQVLAAARRLLVLEGLGDHENLGALFRSARALGVDGVLLAPDCADPLYRRSVRVSMGHVLHVPFARCPDLAATLGELRAAGIEVVALTPAPDAEDLDTLEATDRMALLLGAEGPGLSVAAQAAADRRVRIRLADGVDSLNVATAGAIALHALRRASRQPSAGRRGRARSSRSPEAGDVQVGKPRS